MSGPETRFYTSVHRHLPPESEFHREKMHNPYRGGTADHWYSGRKADLWVEWKFIKLPKRVTTVIDLTAGSNPVLSVLQQQWISNRFDEGRNIWVCVGFEKGCRVFDNMAWANAYSCHSYLTDSLSRQETASKILNFCQGR